MEASFEFMDKELDELFPEHKKDGNRGIRFVDKLVKVRLTDKNEQFVLVHVEVESDKGKGNLSNRMMEYYIRAKHKYKIPVTAIAILADADPHYLPSAYEESFMGTRLRYEYLIYKVVTKREEDLRADPNPFAVVILTVLMALRHPGVEDGQLLEIKRSLYEQMMARRMPKALRAEIYDFLSHYVRFADQGTMVIFEKEIRKSQRKEDNMTVREMLLEQAREEGREEVMALLRQERKAKREARKAEAEKSRAVNVLKEFGVLSMADIAKTFGLTVDQVEAL